MDKDELGWLAEKVEALVDDLKSAREQNKELLAARRKLQQKLASLEKRYGQVDKEGRRIKDLITQNKTYEKKCALLKHKVTSMLAKVEVLQ
jgi:hypothetical protein